jgi:nicotinate-nucleotide adenylyltransferase
MVRAAVGDVDGVEASDLEIVRGGTSFTADTLAELAAQHPGAELFLVIGADVASQLDSWERVDAVRELATLCVVNRPGASRTGTYPGWRWAEVNVPDIDLSSTDLRERARTGRPLDYLIPEAAVRCIRARHLYADK